MGGADPHPRSGFDHGAGWAKLTDLISESETSEVAAVCDSFLRLPVAQRRPRDKVAAGTLHLHELADRSDLIDEIVYRPRLIDVVTTLLGADFDRDEIAYRNPHFQPAATSTAPGLASAAPLRPGSSDLTSLLDQE